MSTTVFKKVDYTLNKLLEDIEMGEIDLPDLQRPFVWGNTKVRNLFDSMYKGFPVGYLLFWANGAGDGHRQIGASAKQKVPRLLIVDGQQRLTSLYAVLKGVPVLRKNYRQERIQIAFCPRTGTFEVADAAVRRDPEFIPDISQLWVGDKSRNRFVKDFLQSLRASKPLTEAEEDKLNEAIDALYDLRTYPFTALELSPSVSEENVSDVFVRINSSGTLLSQADFILTLMSVFWDEGRADLERFAREAKTPSTGAPSSFNYFIQPDPDQLLRVNVALGFRRARLQYVYSILRGKDLETGAFDEGRREHQFKLLQEAQAVALNLQNWHEFLKVLLRAGYRSAEMITSQTGLLYAYAMFLIGRRDFNTDHSILRNVIARWFLMTALTGRYSAESAFEEDLANLRDLKDAAGFVSSLDRIVRDTFTDDFWNITLPNNLASSAARSPALFAYSAALNLLDAKGLFSEIRIPDMLDPALRGNKSPLERHHLFPKGYLAKQGITSTRDTNQIANYAFVEWSDNISISDEAPALYWPKYAARFTRDELEKMEYWHALPDGWTTMKYPDFLDTRRRLMAGVIRDAFNTLW